MACHILIDSQNTYRCISSGYTKTMHTFDEIRFSEVNWLPLSGPFCHILLTQPKYIDKPLNFAFSSRLHGTTNRTDSNNLAGMKSFAFLILVFSGLGKNLKLLFQFFSESSQPHVYIKEFQTQFGIFFSFERNEILLLLFFNPMTRYNSKKHCSFKIFSSFDKKISFESQSRLYMESSF